MLCDPGFVFAGKRKTTIINAIHDDATIAIGRPYEKTVYKGRYHSMVSLNGTYKHPQMKRPA